MSLTHYVVKINFKSMDAGMTIFVCCILGFLLLPVPAVIFITDTQGSIHIREMALAYLILGSLWVGVMNVAFSRFTIRGNDIYYRSFFRRKHFTFADIRHVECKTQHWRQRPVVEYRVRLHGKRFYYTFHHSAHNRSLFVKHLKRRRIKVLGG